MRAIGMAVLALALAACSNGAYQMPAVQGGGSGLPEVSMRASREVVVPPGRGQVKALAVRTFVPAADGGWSEVTGARCHVRGGDFFEATVVTPVRLRLPDLGPDAPVLAADCESGALRGTAAVAPGFSWPEEGRPSAPTRVWWGGGWWWGFEKTGFMAYPDIAVALR
jgi:hypothetical protein